MMESQKDGTVKPVWFKGGSVIPRRCWTGGIPNVNGICCWCGAKKEEHIKEGKDCKC